MGRGGKRWGGCGAQLQPGISKELKITRARWGGGRAGGMWQGGGEGTRAACRTSGHPPRVSRLSGSLLRAAARARPHAAAQRVRMRQSRGGRARALVQRSPSRNSLQQFAVHPAGEATRPDHKGSCVATLKHGQLRAGRLLLAPRLLAAAAPEGQTGREGWDGLEGRDGGRQGGRQPKGRQPRRGGRVEAGGQSGRDAEGRWGGFCTRGGCIRAETKGSASRVGNQLGEAVDKLVAAQRAREWREAAASAERQSQV